MKLELGFNKDISNEDYHADREYISSSALKLILKDPKEYFKRYVKEEKEESISKSAFDFGTYVHALILEPDTVDEEFAIFEGKTRRGKAYDEFLENNEGKIIITSSQSVKAKEMVAQLKVNRKANNIIDLKEGSVEQTLCAELEGIKVKVRTDYNNQTAAIIGEHVIPFGIIVDIKTTSDPIDIFSIGKTIARYDYDLSAALYIDVLQQQFATEQTFIFCFLSKITNEVEIYQASDEMIENGRRKYKAAIRKLKEARKTGIYYSEDAIPTVNLPYWAKFEEVIDDGTGYDNTYKGIEKASGGSEEGNEGETISPTYRPQGC